MKKNRFYNITNDSINSVIVRIEKNVSKIIYELFKEEFERNYIK